MNIKRAYIHLIIGLLILIIGIFIVNAVVDKNKAWHSANDSLISVDDYKMTLQEAIDNNVFIGGATQSYTLEIPDPSHSPDEIWVSTDSGEMTLEDALLITLGLCKTSPTISYSGPSDKSKAYHYANEIEISPGKSFQDAIDGSEFCCVPNCTGKACGADDGCGEICETGSCPTGYTCSAGNCILSGECVPGQTKTKDCDYLDITCRNYYDVTDTCNSSGYWTNPPCNSYTDTAKGTACGSDDWHACDGFGNCNGWSGTGCGNCPFGVSTTESTGNEYWQNCKLGGNQGRYYYSTWSSWSSWFEPYCFEHRCELRIIFCLKWRDYSFNWQIKP